MKNWPWSVLGLEPGADEREIRRAYARLLRKAHPEDNAQAFQVLREAYEAALGEPRDDPDLPLAPTLPPPRQAAAPTAEATDDLAALKAQLTQLVLEPSATDGQRRTALDHILASPALDHLGLRQDAELWLAAMIAGGGAATDALAGPAMEAFGWDSFGSRWDQSGSIEAALERWEVHLQRERLRDPDGPYHEGSVILHRPRPNPWHALWTARRRGDNISWVLDRIEDHPALEADFDVKVLDFWRRRIARVEADWQRLETLAAAACIILAVGGMMLFLATALGFLDFRPAPPPRPADQNCRELARRGRPGQAVNACVEAALARPDDLVVLTDLGVAQLRHGDWRDADGSFVLVLERDPSSARALMGLGLARYGNDHAEGDRLIGQALAVDPRIADVFHGYGLSAPSAPGKPLPAGAGHSSIGAPGEARP